MSWFDEELDSQLNQLLDGKITLSTFKCFLMPNAWYLDLPEDHKALTIKCILAEQNTYAANHSDEEVIEWLRKEFS